MPEGEKEKAEFVFGKEEEKEAKKESPKLTLLINAIVAFLIIGAIILALIFLVALFVIYLLPIVL